MTIEITYREVQYFERIVEVEMTKKEYIEYLKMSKFEQEQKYDLCAGTSEKHHISTEISDIYTQRK
jgi:hypothetical protein